MRTSASPTRDFSGGTLVVSGLLAEDTVSIRNQGGGAGQIGFAAGTVWFGGVEIGTASGGAGGGLTVTLNSAADAAAIEALIENLTYANSSGTPTASRTLTVEVTDAGGAGPSSTAQIAVNVTAENDAPSLTGMAPSVTLLENTVNASPQLLDADVGFADPEENFSGGTLVVSGLLAEDTVSIRNQGVGAGEIGFAAGTVSFGGVAIGTAAGGAGGDLTVTFNGAADSAAIEALIENLTYLNSSSTPTATRTLTFQVTDDIGASTRSAALNFAEFAGTDNPFDNFVVGQGFLDPALGDLDGDGDLDIVVGDVLGGLATVTNTGTPAAPVLAAPAVIAGIDVGLQSAATLGDLDGDGDLDMVVGSFQGRLFTIINNGTAAAPVFNASIHLSALDVCFYRSSPALGDLDGDGDLDLVVGYETGELFTVPNSGTAAAPVFGCAGLDLRHRSRRQFFPDARRSRRRRRFRHRRGKQRRPVVHDHQCRHGWQRPSSARRSRSRASMWAITPPPRWAISTATATSTSWSGIPTRKCTCSWARMTRISSST